MGTCCARCLAAKVRDYTSNAENGAVTVTVIKNPALPSLSSENFTEEFASYYVSLPRCDICGNIAEFAASFFPKKE